MVENDDHTLVFPPHYEEYAWEAETKGWLRGTVAVFKGRKYRIEFYDPTRLAQDIASELSHKRVFLERNLLVIPAVTRANIEAAIADIAKTRRYVDLVAEEEELPT